MKGWRDIFSVQRGLLLRVVVDRQEIFEVSLLGRVSVDQEEYLAKIKSVQKVVYNSFAREAVLEVLFVVLLFFLGWGFVANQLLCHRPR